MATVLEAEETLLQKVRKALKERQHKVNEVKQLLSSSRIPLRTVTPKGEWRPFLAPS